MRTECLVDAVDAAPVLSVRFRCLQVQHRTVERRWPARTAAPSTPVDYPRGRRHAPRRLGRGGRPDRRPHPAGAWTRRRPATRAGLHLRRAAPTTELIADAGGTVVGRFVRRREPVEGVISVAASRPDPDARYLKVAVDGGEHHALGRMPASAATTSWATAWWPCTPCWPSTAGDSSPCSTRPTTPRLAVDGLPQRRVVPGAHRRRRRGPVLADHPLRPPRGGAPEPGDLYDSLEIDEILALRVMTLDRRGEVRGPGHRRPGRRHHRPLRRHVGRDPQPAARADAPGGSPAQHRGLDALGIEIDDRAEEVPRPSSGGTPRSMPPSTRGPTRCGSAGSRSSKGTLVRLRPTQRSDAQDIFLDGPDRHRGRGLHRRRRRDARGRDASTTTRPPPSCMWQGRYLFFHPDEVEPLLEQDQSR